jgi:lysine-specific demethylase 8
MIDAPESMTPEEFEESYYLKNRPCVIRGGALEWPARKKWNPEYLTGLYGSKMVDITMSSGSSFKYSVSKAGKGMLRTSFQEAIKLVKTDFASTGIRYYLMQKTIAGDFPELLQDIEDPRWVKKPGIIGARNLWIGAAGNVSNLHYDLSNNFLVQVEGRKRFILFSPEDYEYVYPAEKTARPNLSQLDPENPDNERFPLFKLARPITFILDPGDVIYMPPFWWHQVHSLDYSISVNFWWRAHINHCFNKPAFDMLARSYEAGLLLDKLNDLDFTKANQAEDIARYYSDRNVPWAAVLILLAYLEEQFKNLLHRYGYVQKEDLTLGRIEQFWKQLEDCNEIKHINADRWQAWKRMEKVALDRSNIISNEDLDMLFRDIKNFIPIAAV